MPISEVVRELSRDPGFWAGFLTGGDPAPAGPGGEARVSLPVADGYGLVLDLDLSTGEHALGLRQPAATEPVHLAGTGPGRGSPEVLRWSEVDLIGRVLAVDDPTLPHPGLPVALLSRFAPVTDADEPATARALLATAYRSLRREVRTVPAVVAEQEPLPMFAEPRWWPQPTQPCDRVISDRDIAGYLAAPATATPARAGPRFPTIGLAGLIRGARNRLGRIRQADWYDGTRALPVARRICVTGDLSAVPALATLLEGDGCDHPTVLDALTGPVVPVEAAWVVETLAGVEPGTLLHRIAAG